MHTTYTLLGLSFIVLEYSWLLDTIRFAGASYLIWLGVSAFMSQKKEDMATASDISIINFSDLPKRLA